MSWPSPAARRTSRWISTTRWTWCTDTSNCRCSTRIMTNGASCRDPCIRRGQWSLRGGAAATWQGRRRCRANSVAPDWHPDIYPDGASPADTSEHPGQRLDHVGRIRIQPAGLDTFHTNSGRLRLFCYHTRMVAELANKTARIAWKMMVTGEPIPRNLRSPTSRRSPDQPNSGSTIQSQPCGVAVSL